MAGVTRRQLEELKRAYGIGETGACRVCRDVYVVGMPGLFASMRRGPLVRTADGLKRGRSVKLTHDEALGFVEGCPECGGHVMTYPIVMSGLRKGPPAPNPWPISEWPAPPETKGKRGNVYDTDEEAEERDLRMKGLADER